MKNIFRPAEFWESVVMTMPDNSFFELIKSVFGKIKTPFNKQQLIKDLEVFLTREDIQKTIAEYIDEDDAKVIAAVALFREPAPGELESFFSGEINYARLQDIIVNLEERFILYRFMENNTSRLALNPVLEQVLSPFAEDTSPLLTDTAAPKTESPQEAARAICLNDVILAAIVSFALQWKPFYKAGGVIRKQINDAWKKCFPGMDLDFIVGCLMILGLFYTDEDYLIPDKKSVDDFSFLSARERSEYLAAALIVYDDSKKEGNRQQAYERTEILPPLFKGKILETANFIHGFLDSLDADRLYTEKTLKRLMEIHKAKTGAALGEKFFEALEITGLVAVSEKRKQLGASARNTAEKHNGQAIIIDASFAILVYPEINFSDAVSIAGFLNVKETGAVIRFELEKDSAARSFDNRVGADEIINLLNRLSLGKADETLIWNLKDWEKRHGEVSMRKGVVLTLAENKRYLAEVMPLASMIEETPAPGVYLLNENMMEEAENVLRGAGIEIIARYQMIRGFSDSRESESRGKAALASRFPAITPSFLADNSARAEERTAESARFRFNKGAEMKTKYRALLEKLPLGEQEKTELSARIDRRLILCEAQLKEADIRFEKLEARHMDYAGKQIIAKQAIATQSPVEIIWPGAGRGKSFFGVPLSLEKEGGEIFLVIIPDGEKEASRVPLAKVSLLRRVRKSIFS